MNGRDDRLDPPPQPGESRSPRAHLRLLEDLENTRQVVTRVRRYERLTRTLLVLVAILAISALADWMWVLPRTARWLGAATALGAAILILVRGWPRYDRHQVAAAVEHEYPELGQQVRTAVEYAEPMPETTPASPGMVQALLRQADDRTTGLDLRRVVPWPVLRKGLIVLALGLLPLVLGLLFRPDLRTAVLRALLVPASYTTLQVEPGDDTIRAAEALNVSVTLNGRAVPSVRWMYREVGGSQTWTVGTLDRPGVPGGRAAQGPFKGSFVGHLEDCRSDLEYRVEAGELESPTYRVRVIQPLTIARFEATVTPPSYTRRPPAVTHDGNFRVVEGSSVQFAIDLNREPRNATLALGALDDPSRPTVPLEIQGTKLSGTLPKVSAEQAYEIVAEAPDGVALEPARYRIQVQPDEPPTLRFVRPEEDLALIPTAEVPIEIQADDDFGLARVGISYRVGKGPEESLLLRDHSDQPLTVRALTMLYLEKHKLTYTDNITYHAFAEDNRPAPPHRVVSELRFIDILPYEQAYQYVEGGGT